MTQNMSQVHDCNLSNPAHLSPDGREKSMRNTDAIAKATLQHRRPTTKPSSFTASPAGATATFKPSWLGQLENTYFPAASPCTPVDLMRGEAAKRKVHNFLHEERAEFGGRKMNTMDVVCLCYLLYAMEVMSQELERRDRILDRKDFIREFEKVVANFKDQGNWALGTKVGAGVMALLGGIAPIAFQNTWLFEKVAGLFQSVRDLGQKAFAVQAGKILQAMAELQKYTGEIHNTYADGHKHGAQSRSELARIDMDEVTRKMEEVKRHVQDLMGMLQEEMRNSDAVTRAVYS